MGQTPLEFGTLAGQCVSTDTFICTPKH